jgi:hypothetical protein
MTGPSHARCLSVADPDGGRLGNFMSYDVILLIIIRTSNSIDDELINVTVHSIEFRRQECSIENSKVDTATSISIDSRLKPY